MTVYCAAVSCDCARLAVTEVSMIQTKETKGRNLGINRVLQYPFKRSVKSDISLQILTLITIRRPPDSEAEADKTKTKSGVSNHKLSGTGQRVCPIAIHPPRF